MDIALPVNGKDIVVNLDLPQNVQVEVVPHRSHNSAYVTLRGQDMAHISLPGPGYSTVYINWYEVSTDDVVNAAEMAGCINIAVQIAAQVRQAIQQ